MLSDWLWLLAFGATFVAVQSLPAGLGDEEKKNEQPMRTKGTLSNSGLDDTLTETTEQQQHQPQQQPQQQQQTISNRPKQETFGLMMDQPVPLPQNEKTYEYGKVLVNEIGDVLPRSAWDLPSYDRYYGIAAASEDRRKRSEDSAQGAADSISSTPSPAAAVASSQPKRSIPSYYQEPRYKRELDIDPEDLFTLFTLYGSERRNRGNWRNYGNEEYETVDDDSNMIGIDDEDPRGSSWLDNTVGYPQQQHHYIAGEPLLSSELAALSRTRPNYYDQYLGQYGSGTAGSSGQQYDASVQYGTPQYGVPYVQHAYYPPEKRFMVSRKRSQNYDSYGGRSGLTMNSRGYPSYQHRLLY